MVFWVISPSRRVVLYSVFIDLGQEESVAKERVGHRMAGPVPSGSKASRRSSVISMEIGEAERVGYVG